MALVDNIGKSIPTHQFMALLYWHSKDPVNMPASKAKSILEGCLKRALTAGEVAEINVMKALNPHDLERAFMLMERRWITRAEAKALLGL
jgi:hypothetical protein